MIEIHKSAPYLEMDVNYPLETAKSLFNSFKSTLQEKAGQQADR